MPENHRNALKRLWTPAGAGADGPLIALVRVRLLSRLRLLLLGAMTLASLAAACGYGGTAQAAPKEKVLFSFKNLRGLHPYAGLIADGARNLYGTTEYGGATGKGVVFELSPPAVGKTAWTETVLQSFNVTNGAYPFAGLIADGAGNLYGTTNGGGANNDGVVFELLSLIHI